MCSGFVYTYWSKNELLSASKFWGKNLQVLALKFECAALGLPIPTNPTLLKSLPLHTAPPIQRCVVHSNRTSSEIAPRRIANDLWMNNHVLNLSEAE